MRDALVITLVAVALLALAFIGALADLARGRRPVLVRAPPSKKIKVD